MSISWELIRTCGKKWRVSFALTKCRLQAGRARIETPTVRWRRGSRRPSITPPRLKPNPGRVAVHRLNRVEYANSIRDLLGLEIDSRSLLPADDSNQESFDNIASVLSVSPVLLEGYLSAAHESQSPCCWRSSMAALSTLIKFPKRWCKTSARATTFPSGRKAARWFVIIFRSMASTPSRCF